MLQLVKLLKDDRQTTTELTGGAKRLKPND